MHRQESGHLEGVGQGRHDHPLLDVDVLQVAATERGEAEVQLVQFVAASLRSGVRHGFAERHEAVHAAVQHLVVGDDLLGHGRDVLLDRRLHDGVLVVSVQLEEISQRANATEQGHSARFVGWIQRTGLPGHTEQLGPDALVDLAVEVEGHRSNAQVLARDRRCVGEALENGHLGFLPLGLVGRADVTIVRIGAGPRC